MNRNVPCYGFDSERLVLSSKQMEQISFTIEKENPIETCPKYEWMSSNSPHGDSIGHQDKRFSTVGYVSLDLL